MAGGQGGQVPTQILTGKKAPPGSGAALLLAHPFLGNYLRPCSTIISDQNKLLVIKHSIIVSFLRQM